MDGTRASTKRKRQQKVKDLETEPESINKCGKLDCMDVAETTNSLIKENESLRGELDSTKEQLKNLQKCHEKADMKYKADVGLLMEEIKSLRSSQSEVRQEIKSLRSSQSELRQELYRVVEKERTQFSRTGASSVLDIIGLNSLPDDVLITILSRLSLVEAVRTSVLSHRWRYLWRFTTGSLDFDVTKTKTRPLTDALVNRVIKLHRSPRLDSFIVRFNHAFVLGSTISRWIHLAMQKEVKRFELKFGRDDRPCCNPGLKLLSLMCAFGSLRSLKFQSVNITDEVVHHLLASCPNLEHLSITRSRSTKDLQIVDLIPNLRALKIKHCTSLYSLKVSAASIVSFSFEGPDSILLFENAPNLTELTLTGDSAQSFIYEYGDNKPANYSVQLVKLSLKLPTTPYPLGVPYNLPLLYALKRLELSTVCTLGESLHGTLGQSLLFILLIKAAPVLHEFRIKVNYNFDPSEHGSSIPYPNISEAEAPTFHHENLKLVEMVDYIGCLSEEKFLLHLFKVAPSLEKVVIEVNKKHFYKKKLRQRIGAGTKKDAKKRAKHLQSIIPPKTQLVVR